MQTITIFLAKALICFSSSCYPALVGPTPIGTFHLTPMKTFLPGYGGEVLAFDQTKQGVYAIHRTYTLIKWQHRKWRLEHGTAKQRHITMGCVNVSPWVYAQLPRSGEVIVKH